MADINNLLTTKIARGFPIRVYGSPTISSDGSIVLSANGGLDPTAHASAFEFGFTQDGAEFSRGTTFEDLPVDQRNEAILLALTGQDAHLKFKALQIRDHTNFQKITPGAAAVTGITGLTGLSDQVSQSFSTIPVVAIAPTPNDATKSMYILLYACYNVAPYTLTLGKKYNVTAVDLKAVDAGRTDGRTWFIGEQS
jgi:hypothetical protein